VTAEQVKAYHRAAKAVIANFSANDHEMDLAAMKGVVAAGVDGINVDYPRLGADAVGRPVERILSTLTAQANRSGSGARAQAILQLSRYRGFALEKDFTGWLLDPDDQVSRAAAVALVTARPRTSPPAFAEALRSANPHARANAAWALGTLQAPAKMLTPLLGDHTPEVLQEALVALSHMPGDLSAEMLLPSLSHSDPQVRGAAALALARHQPDIAAKALPAQLNAEVKAARVLYDRWIERGKTPLTQAEIHEIMGYYRCQMKELQAIAMLHSTAATQALEAQAFRPGEDYSQMNAVVAAFQLWQRIPSDPRSAIRALRAPDHGVADRAEWMLVEGGPSVLPAVRAAIGSQNEAVRERAIRIAAWQGDLGALPRLQAVQESNPADAKLAAWAIAKIQMLHPSLRDGMALKSERKEYAAKRDDYDSFR
jgi:glycerophosphoryl diester phosphodiesterase